MNKINTILLAMAMVGMLGGLAIAQNGDYRDDNRGQRDNNNDNNNRGYNRDSDNYRFGQDRNADARKYGFHNGYRDGWNQGRNTRINTNNRGNGNYGNGNYGNGNYGNRRNEDAGYQSSMGPRGQYKQGYREGFRTGYSDSNGGRRSQYGYVYGQNGQRTPWDPDGDGRPGVTVGNGGYNNGGYNNGGYNNGGYNNGGYNNGGYNNGGYNNGGYSNGSAARFGTQDGQRAGQSDRQSRHSFRPTEWAAYRDADHGLSSSSGYGNSDQYKQEYRQAFMNGYNQAYRR